VPSDNVDDRLHRETPKTAEAIRFPANGLRLFVGLEPEESLDERNFGPYVLAPIAAAHGFGGSLPELERVRARR
jgi:hypothetical protein